MSKHIGTQFVAPNGFEQIEAGRVYYFLKSEASSERVLLLHFIVRPMVSTRKAKRSKNWTPLPIPVLVGLRRARFEHALRVGAIVEATKQEPMPPWLTPLSERNLPLHDTTRRKLDRKGARLHQDRIDGLLAHLWPLVQRMDEVLRASDPSKVINAHARTCCPPQNESRLRLWFYTYAVFGLNREALHYPIHRIGHWDRKLKPDKKFGRPSLVKGPQSGFNSADPAMIEKILAGFRKFAGLGVRMSQIYRRAMLKSFGCRETSDEQGYRYFVHPAGEPFPTIKQFSYRVLQAYGIERVQEIMFGAVRARNRLRASLGRFTESVSNLMERVEADGYWIPEVASGYEDGSPLPKICAVRIRCVASGIFAGIGFSFGGEKDEAYRMAQFCAAIGKVKYCAIIGIEISAEEWPSIGLSPHTITDRGPGAVDKARARTEESRPVLIEIAPSYSPQSKATIESSNPREVRTEGQPTFKTTRMTVTQLVVREVMRTVRDNDSMDVSDRLDNDAVVQRVRPTPLGLWTYLDGLARNDAVPMSFDTAVREFLPLHEFVLRADGAYLLDQRFDSDALRDSGLLDRVATTQEVVVQGYVFPMCVRHVWIEGPHGLVEVSAMLSLRSGNEQLWISIEELRQICQLRRESGSRFRIHKEVTQAGFERRFEEATGIAFETSARQAGRPKRGTRKAVQERAEVAAVLQPHRSAK